MLWDVSQSRLLSGILAVLALAGAATVSDRPALAQSGSHPCHLLTSAQDVPNGFGAAYNLFSAAKELLLSVECGSSSNATLNVGNGQSTTYIYRLGYEWLDGQWKPIAFGGENLVANDWYVGNASANLFRSQTQLAQDNFVVAYTCHWINNRWKCGCRDSSCGTNYWQLQAFRQETASTGGGGSTGGQQGIAAAYSKDKGIQDHPSVVLYENFESGNFNSAWTNLPLRNYSFTSSPSSAHSGNRALQFILPKGGEIYTGVLFKKWDQGGDFNKLHIRWYQKWDSGWDDGPRGNHVGGFVVGCGSACPPGDAGKPANGTNKFFVGLQWFDDKTQSHLPPPGNATLYVYHMDQSGSAGDHFYASPASVPPRNAWLSYELMVKINSVGKKDGEIMVWEDGRMIQHETGLRFRSIDSLAIDKVGIMVYIHENSTRTNTVWFDDVVIAKEYIGPMAP